MWIKLTVNLFVLVLSVFDSADIEICSVWKYQTIGGLKSHHILHWILDHRAPETRPYNAFNIRESGAWNQTTIRPSGKWNQTIILVHETVIGLESDYNISPSRPYWENHTIIIIQLLNIYNFLILDHRGPETRRYNTFNIRTWGFVNQIIYNIIITDCCESETNLKQKVYIIK